MDKYFELCKLKMEDMLVDRNLWVAVILTKPQNTSQDDSNKMDQKDKGLIRLRLTDSVLLNVHEEKTIATLWKNIGYIYQENPW